MLACCMLHVLQVSLLMPHSGVWWRCLTASLQRHHHPAGAAAHQVRLHAYGNVWQQFACTYDAAITSRTLMHSLCRVAGPW